MINVDPNAARRPGLPVPVRRDGRVAAPANAGGPGNDSPHREDRTAARPALRVVEGDRPVQADASVAAAACRAGVALQADLPGPRRGLRADAGERARYRAAYESAAQPPAPRPSLVRSA